MNDNTDIKLVIVESSPIIRSGLASILKRLPEYFFNIFESATIESFQNHMRSHHANLVLINPLLCINFSIATFRKEYPSTKVIAIISGYYDSRLVEASYDDSISIYDDMDSISTKLGNQLHKENPENGETDQLSSREKEIIGCVVKGMTNKEIANLLSISIYTVITHRRNISKKLQIHSSAGLTIYAIVNKIVEMQDIKDGIN